MNKCLILQTTTQLRPQYLKNRPPPVNTSVYRFTTSQRRCTTSPRDEIMNAACDAWWENRLAGNADYTPPWISPPDELNSKRVKCIRKVNFENRSPLGEHDD